MHPCGVDTSNDVDGEMSDKVAPVAAGGKDANNDIGVTDNGDNDDSNASKAKVTPEDSPMKLVIQFGHATEATTVDGPVPNPFVPHRDDPPGVRYEWLPQTNAYLKVYNRAYVSKGVLWRLKSVKLGMMSNGQVGGATNRHPITYLTNAIFSAQSLNRDD